MQSIFIRSGFLLLLFFSFLNLRAQTANQHYLRQYGLLAGNSISAEDATVVQGSAGSNGSIDSNVQPVWAFYQSGNGTAGLAVDALETLRSELNSMGPDQSLGTHILDGQSLSPGVYGDEGMPMELSPGEQFHLNGGPEDIYIFNLSGLQIGDNTVMDLGQVKPENIYWNIQEEFILGGDATFSGIVLANNITLHGAYYGHLTLFAANDTPFTEAAPIIFMRCSPAPTGKLPVPSACWPAIT